jgi:arabinofuranosyltransferase
MAAMRTGELLARYERALGDETAFAVLAVLGALAYVVVTTRWRELPLPVPRWAPAAALALISVLAIAWAWQLRWLSDDAFISFRYARNWADGHGLVFNVGEPVEGYTNFLWTALLAGAYWLGADIPATAVVLCLASHVGVLILTTRLARRLAPEGRPVLVSLAAIALATSYLTATYATGGLETTFGALLVLAALERAHAGQPLAAGALGIAATMAHPDHAIFYVALGAVLLYRRTRLRQLLLYAAPFFLVFVPYFLWRWSYYGLPMPNTYYTKSGGDSYFSQGGVYLVVSAVAAGLVGVLPLAVYGAVRRARDLRVQLAIVAIPLYLVYVAKIGGDFMLGRLLIPILPLYLVLAETGARVLIDERRWRWAAPALIAASLACVPTRIIKTQEFSPWGITDERTFYRFDTLVPLALQGSIPRRVKMLHRYFEGRDPPPVYAAFAIGILGWVTSWPVVDIHGLIDPELSAQPLARRGRPGHERRATPEHIIKRGADLSAMGVHGARYDAVTKIVLDVETYSLTRYRAHLLDPLRDRPEVRFVRFPEHLDEYLANARGRSRDEIRRDLDFFDRYYFAYNPDPVRRGKLAELAGLAGQP